MSKRYSLVMAAAVGVMALSLAACSQKPTGIDALADTASKHGNFKDDTFAYGAGMSRASMSASELTVAMKKQVGTDRVFFAYDSAALSDDAQNSLRKIAAFVKNTEVKEVTVEGHCDERGTREYNLALGERRAVAVKKFLTGLGVAKGTITTVSYGKERPEVDGQTDSAWSKNRRGVVVLK